jgi:hypothetical protein
MPEGFYLFRKDLSKSASVLYDFLLAQNEGSGWETHAINDATIRKELQFSPQSLIRARRELVGKGIIKRFQLGKSVNYYHLNPSEEV